MSRDHSKVLKPVRLAGVNLTGGRRQGIEKGVTVSKSIPLFPFHLNNYPDLFLASPIHGLLEALICDAAQFYNFVSIIYYAAMRTNIPTIPRNLTAACPGIPMPPAITPGIRCMKNHSWMSVKRRS